MSSAAVGEPARHQVEELPVMTVKVIEHRAQRVRCPQLRGAARAELPERGERRARSAPACRLRVAALSVRNRVSRRDVVELCEELFGARISTGTVEAILARAAEALWPSPTRICSSASVAPGR